MTTATPATFTTEVGKDRNGTTRALSVALLGFDNRQLRIETRKHGIYGGVYCNACVVTLNATGYSHAIGVGRGGDFSKTLLHERGARATVQAIERMHRECMANAAAVLAEAIAYYPQPVAQAAA